MPAYNLPDFPDPPASGSRLTAIGGGRWSVTAALGSPVARRVPLSLPAFSTTTAVRPKSSSSPKVYSRLSLSALDLSWSDRALIRQQELLTPAPSLRYIRPPPRHDRIAVQAFTTARTPYDRLAPANWERSVESTLERRLREKVLRSRRGERIGTGLNAGKELRLWAVISARRCAVQASRSGERSSCHFAVGTYSLYDLRRCAYIRLRSHGCALASNATARTFAHQERFGSFIENSARSIDWPS